MRRVFGDEEFERPNLADSCEMNSINTLCLSEIVHEMPYIRDRSISGLLWMKTPGVRDRNTNTHRRPE
jgi:hypothetical protein